ncbi:MAG TPA: LysR family transcriptional regulator [Pseudolysinimonas sp.]|nr:LysR family transcriptional regulator [Pseudolysinimonas sp.]
MTGDALLGSAHGFPQLPTYTLRQLHTFLAIAEYGTLSGAADSLRLSPAAVALSLDNLERALGVTLCVRRKARGITLTAAGRELTQPARELLNRAGDLRDAVGGSAGGLSGALAVGCYVTLAPTLMPTLLERFGAEHPAVRTDFVEGTQLELEAALIAGSLDVAVLFDMDLGDSIATAELFRLRPHVVVNADNPLAAHKTVRLRELADLPFVLLDVPPSSANAIHILRDAGIDPQVRYRTTSLETARSLIGRGMAWSILLQRPPSNVTYEGGQVHALEIADPVDDVRVLMGWSRTAHLSRAAQEMVQISAALLREHQQS